VQPSFLMGAPKFNVPISPASGVAAAAFPLGDTAQYSQGTALLQAPGTLSLTSGGATAGAVFQSIAKLGRGIVDVCRVGSLGIDGLEGVTWTGAQAGDQLGVSLAGAGDLNGDGIDDVLMGAPYGDPNTLTDAGEVYLVLGTTALTAFAGTIDVGTVGTTTAGAVFGGSQSAELAGSSLAGTGDLNGGGTGDFVTGAPYHDVTGGTDGGTVYEVVLDDTDGDGVWNGADCAPDDPLLWSMPGEALGDHLSHNRVSGVTTITWTAPTILGGALSTIRYDTVRSTSRSDFTSGVAVCIDTNGADTSSPDALTPAGGQAFYYLIRAKNSCGPGSAGTTSSGAPRTVRSCP